MKENNEHKLIWTLALKILRPFVKFKFNFTGDLYNVEGPCLVVANHVTTWDAIIMAASFPTTPVHYVASEHLFRHGFLSKLLEYIIAPIPRRKASTAADTVMKCLRRLKAGQVVVLFAEGEACWDGVSIDVFPATGKLARTSGATLMTYRLEGGYPSVPRWTKKVRKGKMRGRIVGVYPPAELKKMKPDEITAIINRDIYENAWERQREEHVKFKAKNRAERIECGYFLCPKCGGLGTIKGVGDHVTCSCGFDVVYTEECFLEPAEPFENLRQWDLWQSGKFNSMDFEADKLMFSDPGLKLKQIDDKHGEMLLCTDELRQYPEGIECGDYRFEYKDIDHMSMVKMKILLFTVGDKYYEIRSNGENCLRKYLAAWYRYQELKQSDR